MAHAPRPLPLRSIFVVAVLMAVLLLLAWGWVERRWAAAGFYLAILAVGSLFLAPPIWSYTRASALDETPEVDPEDVDRQ